MERLFIEPVGGLGNRMRVIASALRLRKILSCDLVCFWVRGPELNCPFELLFSGIDSLSFSRKPLKYKLAVVSLQPNIMFRTAASMMNKMIGIDHCIMDREYSERSLNARPEIPQAGFVRAAYVRTCEELNTDGSGFEEFRPIETIMEKVQSISGKFTGSTVGMHIRRTDHLLSIEHSPLQVFIEKIEQELNEDPGMTFFLSTDDVAVEELLLRTFGDRIITNKKEFSRITVSGVQEAVVDIYCLSRTSKIYGSYSSSFSDVAARIGKIRMIPLMKGSA